MCVGYSMDLPISSLCVIGLTVQCQFKCATAIADIDLYIGRASLHLILVCLDCSSFDALRRAQIGSAGSVQEIDELCDDWQPEPLYSHLTEAQKAYEPPVVSRCAAQQSSPVSISAATVLRQAGQSG